MAYAYYPLTLLPVPDGEDAGRAFERWLHEEPLGDGPVTEEQTAAWALALPRLRELGPGAEDTIEEGDGERTRVTSYGYTYECGIEVGYDSNGSAEVEIPIRDGCLPDRHLGARAVEVLAEVTGLTVYDERAGRVYDGYLPEHVSVLEPAAERAARPWWKRLLGLR
ncbi:hypothetical protein [Kineococcus terrestris]|uniref:hypothetical protein n=1 Tax=Kineococcus terrestris TaxID=2044856 RepID=UPI0034DB1E92